MLNGRFSESLSLSAAAKAAQAVRERIAREVAIRVKGPADRHVFEALGEIFARHRVRD